jgi:mercuric ion transport protein
MDNIPAKTDAVACFLDGQAYRTRVARIHALMDQALIARERLETSVRMRFHTDAGVEAHLEALIALERECCPFLVFALEKRPDEMVLTISGPESAAALLDEAFGGATVCEAVQTPVLRRHTAWAVTAGALTAAFGVATCCALPLALAIFGLGTATSLTIIGAWVAPHKGLVSLIAGVGIACGFLLAYRPHKDQCGGTAACAPPTNAHAMQAVLWLALPLLPGAIFVQRSSVAER